MAARGLERTASSFVWKISHQHQGLPDPKVNEGFREFKALQEKTAKMGPLTRQILKIRHRLLFLLMMNTPSIGTYPGQGIRVWDDQQDLMRNLVGQNGVSVSLHGDGDRVIIDGSGITGLDPNYIVLANNLVTLSKTLLSMGGR